MNGLYGTYEWAARAPGRVNLIGEHTDYNDGFVMPCAIDRGIRVSARARDDSICRLYSHQFQSGWVFDLREVSKESGDSWARYPQGVAAMLQAHSGRLLSGIDAEIESDLPAASGLSSSAAFEAVFAVLWNEIDGLNLDHWTLAKLCQQAEHEYAGVKCGIMDQAASLLAQEGCALFLDTRSLQTTYDPLPKTWSLVVADTGKPRALSDSAYNERREQCEQAVLLLAGDSERHAHALRDISPERFLEQGILLPPVIRQRAAHVLGENLRVVAFRDALQRGDKSLIGRLMRASHESLRLDYEVSCAELDSMQQACEAAPGCVGARMTGAGFGGACIALVECAALIDFLAAAEARYRMDHPFCEPVFLVCRPAQGAVVERL